MGKVQAVVDCQRKVIGNQGQKIDFVIREGVARLSRKTKSSESTECRIQRQHTKGLVSAFTEKPNCRVKPDLLVKRRDEEGTRLLRDHLVDVILPRLTSGLWDDCKSIAVIDIP